MSAWSRTWYVTAENVNLDDMSDPMLLILKDICVYIAFH